MLGAWAAGQILHQKSDDCQLGTWPTEEEEEEEGTTNNTVPGRRQSKLKDF